MCVGGPKDNHNKLGWTTQDLRRNCTKIRTLYKECSYQEAKKTESMKKRRKLMLRGAIFGNHDELTGKKCTVHLCTISS